MIYYYFLLVSLSDVNMKLSIFYRIKVNNCKKKIKFKYRDYTSINVKLILITMHFIQTFC